MRPPLGGIVPLFQMHAAAVGGCGRGLPLPRRTQPRLPARPGTGPVYRPYRCQVVHIVHCVTNEACVNSGPVHRPYRCVRSYT